MNIQPELVRLTDHLQIPYSSLFSKSRKHSLVKYRYCLWYYLEVNKRTSRKALSEFFNKDRATIQYGIEMANFRIEFWADYKSAYRVVRKYFETV